MNKLEMVQFLLKQLKGSAQTHDELVEVYQNYRTMLMALDGSSIAYRNSLQRLREEFPDLERLIGKKFDPILKGRLIDAIMSFKKKIEEIEQVQQDVPETPATTEETPRIRNMPNLGMC